MEDKEQCLECGKHIAELIYAVYSGREDAQKHLEKDAIVGFLCDACRQKKKVKGLKNKNELHKLAALKNLL